MITYIYETPNNQHTVTLSQEEIMQRLGVYATTDDTIHFVKLWNARFHDEDGKPTFYDDEDRDATFAEIQAML